jgi:hypothetical protein
MLASGAPRDDAGPLHVQMSLGKSLLCAAVRTVTLRRGDINGEYFAQFARGSITVKILVAM